VAEPVLSRVQSPTSARRQRRGVAVVTLTAVVVLWWLLIAAAVTSTLPAPAISAPTAGSGIAPGRTMRIHLPGMPDLPIPVERSAFDEAQRGFRESDDDAIERAFRSSAWITVARDQAALIVSVDGDAVQVELLDGPHTGRRGWLKRHNLAP
jgi:hypothetical protein